MNYIFLDCDGVINTKADWNRMYSINTEKVHLIAMLALQTKSEIVLISTWKKGGMDNPAVISLNDTFKKYGVSVTKFTPDLKGRMRNDEIDRFLYFNPATKYVILDDDTSLYKDGSHTKNLYVVNPNTGITSVDVKTVVKKIF